MVEVVDAAKSYTTKGLRLPKEKLGVPETKLHEYPTLYMYYAWCLPEKADDCLRRMVAVIVKRFNADMAQMNTLQPFINEVHDHDYPA